MLMPHVALRMLAACLILAGVLLAGGAMAKPSAPAATPGVVLAASAVPTPAAVAASAPSASLAAEAPACSRKVKVVYAGYGEAARADCAVATTASKAD